MKLICCAPPPALADFVESFWLSEAVGSTHGKERVLPSGMMQLIINLRAASFSSRVPSSGVISGARSEPIIIETANQVSLLGVHFKPGGAFPFLGLPAGELHNTHASLDDLWGRQAVELHDGLLQARTAQGRFLILERFLMARAVRSVPRHPAVNFALKEFQAGPDTRAIAVVANKSGLSHRRFIQVFRDEIGLTPKQFCRVQRFQKVLHEIWRGPRTGWVQLALARGYYDQAHFIHEFQCFAGLSPTAYLRQKGEYVNHVPLAD